MLHVRHDKGKGYAPAEEDEVQRLHDLKVQAAPARRPDPAGMALAATELQGPCPDVGRLGRDPARCRPGRGRATPRRSPTASVEAAAADPRIVAITAAMPGPTGLLPFEARYPERFFDVGIAEQHAMTAAAGMAMPGCARSWRSTRRSSPAPFDQRTSTSGCTACRS